MSTTNLKAMVQHQAPKAVPVALALILTALVGTLLALFLAPRMIGGSPLTISTTVMAPALRPGDLAVVQPVSPDVLAVGDIVAFFTHYEYLAAQRIHELVPGADGQVASLITRVEAVYAEYTKVAANAIKGRIAFSLPMLGHVASAPNVMWGGLAVALLLPLALWHRSSFAAR